VSRERRVEYIYLHSDMLQRALHIPLNPALRLIITYSHSTAQSTPTFQSTLILNSPPTLRYILAVESTPTQQSTSSSNQQQLHDQYPHSTPSNSRQKEKWETKQGGELRSWRQASACDQEREAGYLKKQSISRGEERAEMILRARSRG
jgi:hypothetical protein